MKFDGRGLAKRIEIDLAEEVAKLPHPPRIVSVLVGHNADSELYSALKLAAAKRVGIDFELARTTLDELSSLMTRLARDEKVDGLMVQLPIPGLDEAATQSILKLIPNNKDVDGLRWRESGIVPATVRAVLTILDEIKVSPSQKVVVIGAKGAVGAPLLWQLQKRGNEVIEVGRQTPREVIKQGEVVIACVGEPAVVTGEMVKEGTIVIDVGVSKVEGKVVGDMSTEVYQKASVSVEVPGGVGPVTVVSLMRSAFELLMR